VAARHPQHDGAQAHAPHYAKTGARERGELHAIALRLAAQRSDAGRERLAA
jgi:hypothetical protein